MTLKLNKYIIVVEIILQTIEKILLQYEGRVSQKLRREYKNEKKMYKKLS